MGNANFNGLINHTKKSLEITAILKNAYCVTFNVLLCIKTQKFFFFKLYFFYFLRFLVGHKFPEEKIPGRR